MKTVNIDASDFDGSLDNGEWPDKISEVVEEVLASMRDNPGDASETIQIVIVNDFEPEEEDEESEDDQGEDHLGEPSKETK